MVLCLFFCNSNIQRSLTTDDNKYNNNDKVKYFRNSHLDRHEQILNTVGKMAHTDLLNSGLLKTFNL